MRRPKVILRELSEKAPCVHCVRPATREAYRKTEFREDCVPCCDNRWCGEYAMKRANELTSFGATGES